MKERLTRITDSIERAVVVVLAVGIVLTVFYGVVVRYLPLSGKQMAWSQEVAQLLLVWFAFMSVGMVQRKGAHFNVDLLRSRLSGVGRLVYDLIIGVLTLAFFSYVVVDAVRFTNSLVGSRSAVLQFPTMLYALPLVLCCVVGLVGTCVLMAQAVKRRGKK